MQHQGRQEAAAKQLEERYKSLLRTADADERASKQAATALQAARNKLEAIAKKTRTAGAALDAARDEEAVSAPSPSLARPVFD